MLEKQVEVRQREVVELQTHVKALGREWKDADQADARRQLVERKFQELLEPLRRRKDFLAASREVHQLNRDVEDEIVSRRRDAVVRSESLLPCFPALGQREDAACLVQRPRT